MPVQRVFRIAFIAFLTQISPQLYAQQIAVEAGINRADYVIGFFNPIKNSVSEINYGFPKTGVKVGAIYNRPIWRMVDVGAGLYYAQRSSTLTGQQGEETFESTIAMHYVDIPINLRFNLRKGNWNWYLRAGVLTGLLLNAQEKSLLFPIGSTEPKDEYQRTLEIGGELRLKRFDLSSNLGVGVTWKKLSLNLNYNQTLGSIYNEPDNSNGSYVHWSVWNVSVGYLIKSW